MKDEIFQPANKKSDGGNGNSVINNHERGSNKAKDYVSGDSASSSSSHKFKSQKQKA